MGEDGFGRVVGAGAGGEHWRHFAALRVAIATMKRGLAIRETLEILTCPRLGIIIHCASTV